MLSSSSRCQCMAHTRSADSSHHSLPSSGVPMTPFYISAATVGRRPAYRCNYTSQSLTPFCQPTPYWLMSSNGLGVTGCPSMPSGPEVCHESSLPSYAALRQPPLDVPPLCESHQHSHLVVKGRLRGRDPDYACRTCLPPAATPIPILRRPSYTHVSIRCISLASSSPTMVLVSGTRSYPPRPAERGHLPVTKLRCSCCRRPSNTS